LHLGLALPRRLAANPPHDTDGEFLMPFSLGLEHRQHQTLSPRLQRAVRLLQLSSLDFAQEVHDALGNNPFLENEESEAENALEQPMQEEESISAAAFAEPALTEPIQSLQSDIDGERESWQGDSFSSSNRRNDDSDLGPIDLRAADVSLSDHLHSQLNVLPLPERDLALARAIVDSLDDDGYLRFELPELGNIAGLTPPASAEELQIALNRVQALEPQGVGARSVGECLMLQLSAIESTEMRELSRRIVGEHLDGLAAKDIAGLARSLGCPASEIEAAADCIRRLDPRPGWRFGASHIQYVTPDVIVKKVRGNWTASLNPAIVPRVKLNNVYAEMFQRNRNAQHAELAAQLQEARWTVSNVEQRFATILSVAQAIVKRQRHFLEYGALAMKPLGLREIADEVGLHESTVSRVTNNKYMATPLGVFELKYFFSRAMTTASGGACSATAIRGLIKDMIAGEDPAAPLSDAEIARQLARQGLVVARRTVTKYRQILRIEAVERRRKHS
jgi:RNA polymerase sigma-54 factor